PRDRRTAVDVAIGCGRHRVLYDDDRVRIDALCRLQFESLRVDLCGRCRIRHEQQRQNGEQRKPHCPDYGWPRDRSIHRRPAPVYSHQRRGRRARRGIRRSGRLQQWHRPGRRAYPVVAGNSLVAAAILFCEKCGAKLRPGRERCPRCRAFVTVPNPAREREASRKLAAISAVVAGTFVVLLAGLWVWREWGTPRAPAKSVGPAVASAPREPSAASGERPKPLPQVGRDRPFMDAAGAGAAAYGEGDYASALEQFQAAVEKNPQDTDSLSNLGQVLVKLNRPADAIPYFTRAVALAPDRWAYQFNLARALGQVGRLEESIQGYRTAQVLFPNDYVTTFNLALSL